MKYPIFLKDNDIIGVTAPSAGITDEMKLKRIDNAYQKLKDKRFSILETNNVRTCKKGRSGDAKTRAQQFMDLIENKEVKGIIFATGGDFLLEILPYLDFEKIRKNPKWIQGYSDPTGILFPITTKLDIATIYSNNIAAFGMEPWHESISQNLEILKGNLTEQYSFEKYEKGYTSYVTGLEPYQLDSDVEWKNLFSEEIKIEGRLLGGCLDLLAELAGTPYDSVKEFIKRYSEDGIIWYFDNCELTCEDLIRTFWKLESCGWFQKCKGILMGRSATESSYYNISFKETLEDALKHLNIPVIYDMDFGHLAPRMTIINGGYATITSKDGKGSITYQFK